MISNDINTYDVGFENIKIQNDCVSKTYGFIQVNAFNYICIYNYRLLNKPFMNIIRSSMKIIVQQSSKRFYVE